MPCTAMQEMYGNVLNCSTWTVHMDAAPSACERFAQIQCTQTHLQLMWQSTINTVVAFLFKFIGLAVLSVVSGDWKV
jgi:hypothetical protein